MIAQLTLPWPPSTNSIWRRVGNKTLLSAEGRLYRQRVAVAVMQARLRGAFGTKRLGVRIQAYPPDKRRRDLDNLLKATLDACTHASLWDDDSQVDSLSIHREGACTEARLVIEVAAL
jgi:crossover junction endodeoxyribonuclease RusA